MAVSIKWRKQDEVKLSRYVRKFNTAITKYSNANPDLADAGLVPQKLSVYDLKKSIYSRNDFNRQMRRIDRFFRKGQRDIITDPISGFKTMRWTYNEARYTLQSVNRRREEMVKKLKIAPSQFLPKELKPVSLQSQMQEMQKRIERLGKFRNNYDTQSNIMQGWDMFLKQLVRRSSDDYYDRKNSQYYDNYIQSLYSNFGNEKGEELEWLIISLGLNGYELYMMSLYDDGINIDYMYGPEQSEDKYNQLLDLIPKVYEEMTQDVGSGI